MTVVYFKLHTAADCSQIILQTIVLWDQVKTAGCSFKVRQLVPWVNTCYIPCWVYVNYKQALPTVVVLRLALSAGLTRVQISFMLELAENYFTFSDLITYRLIILVLHSHDVRKPEVTTVIPKTEVTSHKKEVTTQVKGLKLENGQAVVYIKVN